MEQKDELMGIPQLIHFNAMLITGALFIGILLAEYMTTDNSMWIMGFILVLSLGLLVTSADFFIEGAKGLARRAGIAEIVIGLTIVSIGTSLPEILVTSSAALDAGSNPGSADFAIGSILGSVLVQITLILGIVVMTKSVKVRPSWLNRDGVIMLLSVMLLIFFVWTNGTLERWEGAVLSALYVTYIVWLLMKREAIRLEEVEESGEYEVKGSNWSSAAYTIMIIVGLGFAIYAAQILVDKACFLALELGVKHSVVGTTVSGIGTSLPELTIALMAAQRSKGVAIGTLIGSNITDPLLSIGIASMIHPLSISENDNGLTMEIIAPATVLGVLLALIFMRRSYRFERWEGACLALFYLVFLVVLQLNR